MYLLDTDVVSHLRRLEKAHPKVAAWAASTPVVLHFISSITLRELELGILPVDTVVAQRCAKLYVPDPKPQRDAFIAATALVHGMAVVTCNVDDFKPTGVEVLNPWEWGP